MDSNYNDTCLTCKSIQGIIHLSKFPRIHETNCWIVEHMSPCAIKGWIVVALKRHCTGLHELNAYEFADFANISRTICLTMRNLQNSEKEYLMQFAEGDNFGHVHFHLIARLSSWPQEFKGAKIFNAIDPTVSSPISNNVLESFVLEFKKTFNELLVNQNV
jgi:diadenosine tetraphosphate (Ap4A) HIT family hydrolase